jgi:hypothetical protein
MTWKAPRREHAPQAQKDERNVGNCVPELCDVVRVGVIVLQESMDVERTSGGE